MIVTQHKGNNLHTHVNNDTLKKDKKAVYKFLRKKTKAFYTYFCCLSKVDSAKHVL